MKRIDWSVMLKRVPWSGIVSFAIALAILGLPVGGLGLLMRHEARQYHQEWSHAPRLIVSQRVVTRSCDIYSFVDSDTIMIVDHVPYYGRVPIDSIAYLSDNTYVPYGYKVMVYGRPEVQINGGDGVVLLDTATSGADLASKPRTS